MSDVCPRCGCVDPLGHDSLQRKIEALQVKISHYAKLLDDKHGHPCDQIKLQQKIEVLQAENAALKERLDVFREDSASLLTAKIRIQDENARLRGVLKNADCAINAAYAQAQAEWQGHDKVEARHDETIRQWRKERDVALAEREGK